jgi:putative endonuclease
MRAKDEVGRKGEAIAARFLERLGYRIRARNYRCSVGEIDLVAIMEGYLVFVEVKTRTAGKKLHPSLSVTPRKQAKVRQVGEHYCSHHPELTLQPRFDVIAVEVGGEAERVEHIVNAF